MDVSEAQREFAKDVEVGDFNLKSRNYRGAELRYWHALEYKPDDPDTTFKLAEAIDKQGRHDEAREAYGAYLELQPTGPLAERARKTLNQSAKNSVKKR